MKVLKVEKKENCIELVVVKRFLMFKWVVTYRKVDGNVFRYTEENEYINTGLGEHCEMLPYFKIKLE